MNFSDVIEKAKYISRKRVGNRYVYKYADDKKGRSGQTKDPAEILQKLDATHALMAIADGKDQPVPRTNYQDWNELQEKGLVTRVGKKFFNRPRAPLGQPGLRSSKNRLGGESPKNFKLTALGKKVVAAEKARRNAPYGT